MALNNKTVVMPLQCPDFRPHLIEAIVNWCENRGQTPYMLVEVDDACDVPRHLANPDNTMVFFSYEIKISGSVQNVYLVLLPRDRNHRCSNGKVSFDLFFIIITDSVAIFHFA